MKDILSTEEYLAERTPPGREVDVDMLCAIQMSMHKQGVMEVGDDDFSDDDPVYRKVDLDRAFTTCVAGGMRCA